MRYFQNQTNVQIEALVNQTLQSAADELQLESEASQLSARRLELTDLRQKEQDEIDRLEKEIAHAQKRKVSPEIQLLVWLSLIYQFPADSARNFYGQNSPKEVWGRSSGSSVYALPREAAFFSFCGV